MIDLNIADTWPEYQCCRTCYDDMDPEERSEHLICADSECPYCKQDLEF